jgi:hypothetical protein
MSHGRIIMPLLEIGMNVNDGLGSLCTRSRHRAAMKEFIDNPPSTQLETQKTPGRFGRVTLAYTVLVPEEYRGVDLLRCVVTHAQLEVSNLRVYIHI